MKAVVYSRIDMTRSVANEIDKRFNLVFNLPKKLSYCERKSPIFLRDQIEIVKMIESNCRWRVHLDGRAYNFGIETSDPAHLSRNGRMLSNVLTAPVFGNVIPRCFVW